MGVKRYWSIQIVLFLVLFALLSFQGWQTVIRRRRELEWSRLFDEESSRRDEIVLLLEGITDALAEIRASTQKDVDDIGKEIARVESLLEAQGAGLDDLRSASTVALTRYDKQFGRLRDLQIEVMRRLSALEAIPTEQVSSSALTASDYAALGHEYSRAGHHAKAAELFLEAWSHDPHPPEYAYHYAASLWEIPPSRRDDGEIRRALDSLLIREPMHPQGRRLSYELALTMNDQSRALSDGERLIEAQPEDGQLAYQLGRLLLEAGEFESAISPLEVASRHRAEDPMAPLYLGDAHRALDDVELAEHFYSESLSRKRGFPAALERLASLSFDQARYREAAMHWEEALRAMPEDPELHFSLGEARMALGETEKAIQAWQEALDTIQIPSEDNRVLKRRSYENLATASFALGDEEEALQFCRQALALQKTAPMLLLEAQLLSEIDQDKARGQFQRLLAAFPESPEAEKARALLEQSQ